MGDNDWPEDIHFANGLWVCANDYGQIYTSADLAIWTLRYDAPLPWILTSIDYQNGRWVVVGGANGEGDTKGFEGGNIVTSTDGINWIDQVPVEKSAFVGEVAYRLSPIAYRLSPIAYRLSPMAVVSGSAQPRATVDFSVRSTDSTGVITLLF